VVYGATKNQNNRLAFPGFHRVLLSDTNRKTERGYFFDYNRKIKKSPYIKRIKASEKIITIFG